MTRPVLPLDPAGNTTDRLGPHGQGGNVGPPAQAAGIAQPMPTGYAVPHVYPYSDILNWPAVVQQMLLPSTSATMMVGARWMTERNVVADAEGIPSPFDHRQEAYVPIANATLYTSAYSRQPNTASGVPAGTKMSAISGRFAQFLSKVQSSLIGSP